MLGRRLAIPATPQPGEGLPDIFVRAIHRNGEQFTQSPWKAAFGKQKVLFSHRNYVDLDVDDGSIADFLGTPVGASDIAPLRYTRVGPGKVSFFGANISLTQLAKYRRVSPRFLASNGYQKAVWSLLSLGFDPLNREYLIDRCPNPDCGVQLTFTSTLGLSFCHACADLENPARGRTDLREWPQPLVELESFENVDFACSLIDPELDPRRHMTALLHPDLRSLGRGEVFEFILILARIVDREKRGLYGDTVSPEALSEATGAVRNWPNGVVEIAEMVQGLWRRHSHRKFHHPIFADVYCSEHLFGIDFYHLVRAQIDSGMRAKVGPPLPAETRTERFRRPIPRTFKEGALQLSKRGDKLLFASMVARASKPIKADFKAIGLPFAELISLYSDGYVGCPDKELVRVLVKSSRVPTLSVRLKELASSPPLNSVSLYKTVTSLSDGKIAWIGIIRNILDGNLQISIEEGHAPLIHRVRIADSDRVEQLIVSQSYAHWGNDVVLTNYETGFYLGIAKEEVSKLVSGGLLPTGGVKLSDVRRFHQRYILGAEIIGYLETRGYPRKALALVFSRITQAGILPLFKPPSVRDRTAMRKYFRGLGASKEVT